MYTILELLNQTILDGFAETRWRRLLHFLCFDIKWNKGSIASKTLMVWFLAVIFTCGATDSAADNMDPTEARMEE